MEFADWIAVITLLGGSGIITTGVTLLYNHLQNHNQIAIEEKRDAIARDFEARKEAKEYYKKIYGHIAVLDELMRGYVRSIDEGKARVFTFKKCEYAELPSAKILEEFRLAYANFSSYYIKMKCAGFEIFVSKELKQLLIRFWDRVQAFHEDEKQMASKKEVEGAHLIAEETTEYMEKLFGLRELKGGTVNGEKE